MNVLFKKDDMNCICLTINQTNDSFTVSTEGYIQGLEEQSNLDKQSNLNDLEAAQSHDLRTIISSSQETCSLLE